MRHTTTRMGQSLLFFKIQKIKKQKFKVVGWIQPQFGAWALDSKTSDSWGQKDLGFQGSIFQLLWLSDSPMALFFCQIWSEKVGKTAKSIYICGSVLCQNFQFFLQTANGEVACFEKLTPGYLIPRKLDFLGHCFPQSILVLHPFYFTRLFYVLNLSSFSFSFSCIHTSIE